MMVSECDSRVRVAIPAIRIAVAKLLKSKYNMGQQEIARRMGITQASVNKYLNGRYSARIKRIAAGVRAGGGDKKIASMIASGKRLSLVNEHIDKTAARTFFGGRSL